MGADEEYLDNLLKSVTAEFAEDNKSEESEPETLSEELFSVEELLAENSPVIIENEEGEAEEISLDDFVFDETEPMEEVSDGDTPLDIDAMLKELNLLNEDMSVPGLEDEAVSDPFEEPFYTNDLEEDLNEINSLLEKADNNEAINEDMLSMFSASFVDTEPEEPFDLMGEINNQETLSEVVDKKAEKERKRKEKEDEKAAKKAAKIAAKEQKKTAKGKKADQENAVTAGVDDEAGVTQQQENSASESEDSAFDNFQEVDEFDDIEALLGSLNMDDLEFSSTPVESKSAVTPSEPEPMLSMADFREDEVTDENNENPKEETAEKEKGQKKEGFFKRFVDFLMEEDEDEEEVSSKKKKKGPQEVDVTEEDDALKEMEKRGKKVSKAKAKNAKKGPADDDNEVDNKKGKKKVKKLKKVKQPQSEMAKKFKVIDDGKKVGKGGMLSIILLAASVFAVVMLSNIIFSPMLAKNRAEKAFKEQDYETCYQELAGWELSESESEMRDYAKVVLKMERRLDAYEQYKELRQKLEALDSLMKAVQNYDEIYQEAINCGAVGEVEKRYDTIINILAEEYGVAEKDAKAITALTSDIEYTRYLTAIIEGKDISDSDNDEVGELPGFLPEEEELPDTKFSE